MSSNLRRNLYQEAIAPQPRVPLDPSNVKDFSHKVKSEKDEQGPRVFGCLQVPIFAPTSREFSEPLAYIESIRSASEKFGMCKIIPPSTWQPEVSLETETFRFRAKKPSLTVKPRYEGPLPLTPVVTVASEEYLQDLMEFHKKKDVSVPRVPVVNGKYVDYLVLKGEVQSRGGFQQVTDSKRWSDIARSMKLDGKASSVTAQLKSLYTKFIQPFEEYESDMEKHRQAMKELEAQEASADAMAEEAAEMHLSVAPETPRNGSPIQSRAASQGSVPATPEAAKVESNDEILASESEPEFRDEISEPRKRKPSSSDVDSVSAKRPKRSSGETPKRRDAAISAANAISDAVDACMICRTIAQPDKLLICDGCERGCHMFCLNPPLLKIPRGDWFCPECQVVRSLTTTSFTNAFDKRRNLPSKMVEEEVYDDSHDYTLYEFQKMSEDLKQTYFHIKKDGTVSDKLVEEEFWNVIDQDMFVDGTIVHAPIGDPERAFPFVEKAPADTYSRCSWNFNVSALAQAVEDLCVIRPKITVGMVFSAKPWQIEEHMLPLICYNHVGESSTFYSIAESSAEDFARQFNMQDSINLEYLDPEKVKEKMISPQDIIKAGIPVNAVELYSHEMLVTFPGAYHASFAHGFNILESVNFASPSWLAFSRQSMGLYNALERPPLYSHDRLVCANAINGTTDYQSAVTLKAEMEHILEDLRASKNHADVIGAKEEIFDWETPPPTKHCHECNIDVSIGYFVSGDKISCRLHTDTLDKEGLRRIVVYGIGPLEQSLEKIVRVVNRPTEWLTKFHNMIEESPIVSLKVCQSMFAAAYKLPVMPEEARELGEFISVAEDWLKRCHRVLAAKRRLRRKGAVSEWDGRSLNVVQKLLKENRELAFEVPEIATLVEFERQALAFRQQVEEALADSNLSGDALYETLSTLIERGNKLDVDMDEMDSLKERLSEVGWWKRTHTALQKSPMKLKECLACLQEAEESNIPEDDYTLKRLRELCALGETWTTEVMARLRRFLIQEDELHKFIENAEKIPVDIDLLEKLVGYQEKIADWTVKAKEMLQNMDSGDASGSQKLSSLRWLVAECNKLPIRNKDYAILRYQAKTAETLLTSLKSILKKEVAVGLEELVQNFDLAVNEDPDLYCFCRSDEDYLSVECETCKMWYHPKCLKISNKEVNSGNFRFICALCDPRKHVNFWKSTEVRPTFDELMEARDKVSALRFVPDEAEVLNKLIDKLVVFKNHTESVLAKTDEELMNHLQLLRDCLRKMESSKVTFPALYEKVRARLTQLVPIPDENAGKIYCICKKPYDPSSDMDMIQCEDCADWFHYKCVNLTAEQIPTLSDWSCPGCAVRHPETILSNLEQALDPSDLEHLFEAGAVAMDVLLGYCNAEEKKKVKVPAPPPSYDSYTKLTDLPPCETFYQLNLPYNVAYLTPHYQQHK